MPTSPHFAEAATNKITTSYSCDGGINIIFILKLDGLHCIWRQTAI